MNRGKDRAGIWFFPLRQLTWPLLVEQPTYGAESRVMAQGSKEEGVGNCGRRGGERRLPRSRKV
eukprot:9482084-Pyramimonas_sp.AAC.1